MLIILAIILEVFILKLKLLVAMEICLLLNITAPLLLANITITLHQDSEEVDGERPEVDNLCV